MLCKRVIAFKYIARIKVYPVCESKVTEPLIIKALMNKKCNSKKYFVKN